MSCAPALPALPAACTALLPPLPLSSLTPYLTHLPAGELLVSGSDDQDVILWDWQAGRQLLRYASGHSNNVFQARLLPGLGVAAW